MAWEELKGMTWEKKFAVWRTIVETHVLLKTGLRLEELPEWRYVEAFESGMPPSEAAEEVIKNAGYFFGGGTSGKTM